MGMLGRNFGGPLLSFDLYVLIAELARCRIYVDNVT